MTIMSQSFREREKDQCRLREEQVLGERLGVDKEPECGLMAEL